MVRAAKEKGVRRISLQENRTPQSLLLNINGTIPGVDMGLIKSTWTKVMASTGPEDQFPWSRCQEIFFNKILKLIPEAKPLFQNTNQKANMFSSMMKTIIFLDKLYIPDESISGSSQAKLTRSVTENLSVSKDLRSATLLNNNCPTITDSFSYSKEGSSKISSFSNISLNFDLRKAPARPPSRHSFGSGRQFDYSPLTSPSSSDYDDDLSSLTSFADQKKMITAQTQAMTIEGYEHLRTLGKEHVKMGITKEMYEPCFHAILCVFEMRLKSEFTAEAKKAFKDAFAIIVGVMTNCNKKKPPSLHKRLSLQGANDFLTLGVRRRSTVE